MPLWPPVRRRAFDRPPGPYRTRTVLLAACCLALAAPLSGCGLLSGPQRQPSAPTVAQLKQELLTAPPGSKPFARGTLGPGGILTLAQFVDGDFAPPARATQQSQLAQDGYKASVEADWSIEDESVDVFLVQFTSPSGAQDFISRVSNATAEYDTGTQGMSSLPGVDGGEAWTPAAVDSVGNVAQYAWFTVGDVAVDLHYFSPAGDPAVVDRLAQAQQARLSAQATTPSPLPVPAWQQPAPTTGPGTAPATTADRDRLLHDLVPTPSDAIPENDDPLMPGTGILGLPQLAARMSAPAGQATFLARQKDRGFQYAVAENWNDDSDGTEAGICLVQFATDLGAQSFVLGYQSTAHSTAGTSGSYPVPHSGDAEAYEDPGRNSFGNSWTQAYAVVGNVALVVSFTRASAPDRADVLTLVHQQYQALTADPVLRRAASTAPPLPAAPAS